MKKKNPKHPKLYLDIIHQSDQIILTYISNRFDQNENRIIQQEILNSSIKSMIGFEQTFEDWIGENII